MTTIGSTYPNTLVNSLPRKSFISTLGERIHEKVDALLTRLAFGRQLEQLDIIGKKNPEIAAIKRDSLNEHIKTVSTVDKLTLALKLLVEKINVIRTLTLRYALHPATSFCTYKQKISEYRNYKGQELAYPVYNSQGLSVAMGRPINFYSKDHQQLDGMILYKGPTLDKTKPTLVMCPGNGMTYEDLRREALVIAEKNQANIVLYNARGVGLSLGDEFTTDEAVEDCKAALKYALTNLCDNDPDRLQAFGHSLGGGITAQALKELIHEKVFERIGVYFNHRSFASLPDCLEGLSGISAKISRVGFALLGLNPLNAADALLTTNLAKKVYVVTAENDQIMKNNGRLANYLQRYFSNKKQNIKKDLSKYDENKEIRLKGNQPRLKGVEFYTQPGVAHNDMFDMEYILKKIRTAIPFTEEELDSLAL